MSHFPAARFVRALALGAALALSAQAFAQADPLPSWNDGAAKKAIVDFVQTTTTQGSPNFVPAPQRIAAFDQDGTLWVEHPMYSQVMYVLESVPALVKAKPELAKVAPFSTVLEILKGDRAAIAKLNMADLESCSPPRRQSVETFAAEARKWLGEARDPRWKKPYTELTYLPMQELLKYLRANGYKTYIVTGGGQDFVRVYSEATYGIPPEQVVGSAGGTKYGYGKDGRPFLTKEPKLLLNDNNAGKPEGIHLMIGRRPVMAAGNSTGDRQMLEYAKAGSGARLSMLVLHDDAKREYAYGPAQGLPETKAGSVVTERQEIDEAGGRIGSQHEAATGRRLRSRNGIDALQDGAESTSRQGVNHDDPTRTTVAGRGHVTAMTAATPAHAEMSAEELAKLAQNPVGNLISVPFQNNTNLNFGPEKGTQNILNIQPVIPISVSNDWNIITRTILPVISHAVARPGRRAHQRHRRYGLHRVPVSGQPGRMDLGCRPGRAVADEQQLPSSATTTGASGRRSSCCTSIRAVPGCTACWSTISGR